MTSQNITENFSKSPKISVMLLTYNRAKLLPRAIKSVLNQTFGDFELVIVNNAATDNTGEIIQGFLGDNRIVYKKHEKNTGPFGGLNTALDTVTGKYVINLSDDDELLPDALETISEKFDQLSPKGIKILWFDCIDAETQRYSGSGIREEGYITYEDYLCNKFKGDYQVAMERSVMGNIRFDQQSWGGMTTAYNLKCLHNNKAYHIPKIIGKLYREHGESRITKAKTSLLNHIPKIVLTMKDFLKEFGEEIKKICPKQYGERLASLGFYQILNGEKQEGRINILESLKFRFSLFHLFLFIFSFILNTGQLKYVCLLFFRIKERISKFLKRFSKPITI